MNETPIQVLLKEDHNFKDSTIAMAMIIERMKIIEFSILADGMTLKERQQLYDQFYANINTTHA